MTYRIDADYSKTYLLPPAVEDWVPPDHPVRFVREFVDQYLSTELVFDEPVSSGMGRPAYAPELLLKIWVAAYLSGHRSCRKVEQLCVNYLPFVWLATGERPDHNTLWRFWQRHHKVIAAVFGASVNVARRLGLVEMALHAVNGTKIAAAGSTHRVADEESLNKKLSRLDERIRQIEMEIEQARAKELEEPQGRLSEELQDRQRLRERVRAELEIVKREARSVHPGEPEARLMKKVGLGYNAQNVIDARHGIIVAQNVVTDANDEEQLVPMLDRVAETLGETAKETLGDAGYNTLASVAGAADKNYSILLSPSSNDPESNTDNPYHITKFEYDEEADQWICPQGKILSLRSTGRDKRRNVGVKVYRTRECRKCPVRDQCTRNPNGRSIEFRDGLLEMIRQRQKRAQNGNRELLRRRMAIAERPFAVIKSIKGFRRFRLSGLTKAQLEWSFMTAIYNIEIIMRKGFDRRMFA